jgi:hypothetical protein
VTIDERFSAERFRALPADDPTARAGLIQQLQDEITAELHGALQAGMAEIAERLHGLGHRLSLFEDEVGDMGEVGYHDDHDPPGGAHCWLRIDGTFLASAGWAEHANGDTEVPQPTMWEVRLLVETDDPEELDRITDAVANIGCPLPVSEHDQCPTPWWVVSTPLEQLDEEEAARWRDVLNRE